MGSENGEPAHTQGVTIIESSIACFKENMMTTTVRETAGFVEALVARGAARVGHSTALAAEGGYTESGKPLRHDAVRLGCADRRVARDVDQSGERGANRVDGAWRSRAHRADRTPRGRDAGSMELQRDHGTLVSVVGRGTRDRRKDLATRSRVSGHQGRMNATRELVFSSAHVPSPIGPLIIVTDDNGRLRALDWVDHEARMRDLLNVQYGCSGASQAAVR